MSPALLHCIIPTVTNEQLPSPLLLLHRPPCHHPPLLELPMTVTRIIQDNDCIGVQRQIILLLLLLVVVIQQPWSMNPSLRFTVKSIICYVNTNISARATSTIPKHLHDLFVDFWINHATLLLFIRQSTHLSPRIHQHHLHHLVGAINCQRDGRLPMLRML